MGLQVQPSSPGNGKAALGEADDSNDLNALARQTLAGVKANVLPPEPFASGFDLAALAATSRSSHPPSESGKSEDTDGKLDLRAAAASARALRPRPAAPRRRVVELSPSPAAALSSVSPTLTSAPAAAPAASSALDRELEALIQARAFSPGRRLAASAAELLAAARQAPRWSWGLAGAVVAAALVAALNDGAEQAPAATSVASGSQPAIATAAPALPAGVTIAAAAANAASPRSPARAGGRTAWTTDRPARAAGQPESEREQPATSTSPALTTGATADAHTLDTLLDRAIGGSSQAIGAAHPAAPAGASSTLPDMPDRDAVARAFAEVQPRIRFCAGGRAGVATAAVVFKRDGRVASARISGAPFSRTAAGRCMESVLRGTRVPAFEQPTFRVSYPFQL